MEEQLLEKIEGKLKQRLVTLEKELVDLKNRQSEVLERQSEDLDQAAADSSGFDKEVKIDKVLLEQNLVELALKKLTAGTYGLCEKCQQPIDPARLEIFPIARLCMNCKVICDNCGEELEEARILGKAPPLICQSCYEEIEPETTYRSSSIIPKK